MALCACDDALGFQFLVDAAAGGVLDGGGSVIQGGATPPSPATVLLEFLFFPVAAFVARS